jgi:hypothetical protein
MTSLAIGVAFPPPRPAMGVALVTPWPKMGWSGYRILAPIFFLLLLFYYFSFLLFFYFLFLNLMPKTTSFWAWVGVVDLEFKTV